MSGSYDRLMQKCAECGAQCGPTALRCWMCEAPLGRGLARNIPDTPVFSAAPEQLPSPSTWSSETLGPVTPVGREAKFLLLIALCIIGAGLWVMAPGFAILYVIVVIPALIATFVSVDRQKQAGQKPTLGDQVAELLIKVIQTVGILFLLMFGIVIAVGVFCFILLARMHVR